MVTWSSFFGLLVRLLMVMVGYVVEQTLRSVVIPFKGTPQWPKDDPQCLIPQQSPLPPKSITLENQSFLAYWPLGIIQDSNYSRLLPKLLAIKKINLVKIFKSLLTTLGYCYMILSNFTFQKCSYKRKFIVDPKAKFRPDTSDSSYSKVH